MEKTIRETLKKIGVTGIGEKDMSGYNVIKINELTSDYSGRNVIVYRAESEESASKEIAEVLGTHIPAKIEYFIIENRTPEGSERVDYLKIWFDTEPSEHVIIQVLVLHSLVDSY